MTIDVGALFEQAQGIIAGAIPTAGTTVTFTEDTDGRLGGESDPDTLAVTAGPEPVTIAAGVPALVVPAGVGNNAQRAPGVDERTGDYRILLLPEVTAVQVGHIGTVDTSLDPRLVGRRFLVTDIPDSSAGAVRTLIARPQPPGIGDPP